MVQEIRRIMLTEEELICALECYRRMHPDFLPAGKIVRCGSVDKSGIKVMIETGDKAAPRPIDLTLSEANILQPLIRFCIENNIMLPKNGRKSTSIVEGATALHVTLNLDIDLSAYAATSAAQMDNARAITPATEILQSIPKIRKTSLV